jgi:DNA-binding PadR family transcriptional regulator
MVEQNKSTQRIVKSFIDLIILSLLRNNPRWGYEIMSEVHRNYGVKLSAGTLYPLLYVLEENGYLKGEWRAQKKKKKRIYVITDDGTNFLEESMLSVKKILNTLSKD